MRGWAVRGGRLPAPFVPGVVVFALAVGTRVGSVLWRGGYGGYFNYDSGVYYAAASALVHGRLPYRDFTLVHPPASTLVLTPFAAIGDVTTDKTGYLLANLFFTALGAGAAVLAMLVVRQIVPSRLAMWTAGVGYAVYVGAVNAEREARLEPLGNILLLLGLFCALRAARAGWGSAALGGAALAGAVSVKIWYVVPAVIVLAAYLSAERRRRLRPTLIGLAVAAVLINGPFFLAASRAMFRAVINDQLSRPVRAVTGTLARLAEVSGLPGLAYPTELSHRTQVVAAVITVLVLAVGVVLAATVRDGRIPAAMLLAQGAVLYSAPSFFRFYVDYLTPAATVCVGIAVGVVSAKLAPGVTRARRAPVRAVGLLGLAGVSTLSLVLIVSNDAPTSGTYPAAQFTRAVAGSRCVMTNNPEVLIQLDALSRGLADGCRNWVDFNGRLLGPDRYRTGPGPGPRNRKWHRSNADYLLSGDAVALLDGQTVDMSKRLVRILGTAPVIARSGRLCVVRISDRQRAQLRNRANLPPVPGNAATPAWCAGPDVSSGR